ncbi:FkbM family methyltransferase [Halpernia frigidisoli]|uniref:Methyltransferase, FkbM family n=1 Tax=Halpernia frigidisoli TaxID=1125876 RepID=A0A1I3F9T8_9FLAO|nr:FkbM family methyltransferase [Halpernia frigidisoli]SFI07975.1 methyltransferase, FkbM family [Halpernia frigidisoli]
MSLYARLAEQLQFISPAFYKSRYFKKIDGLNSANLIFRNVELEMLWLKNHLKKDAVFFDIGCNVGSYLRLVENILKSENIYAFEPNQRLFKRLERLFPKVNLFSIALSDENTTAEFKVPVINGQEKNSRGTLITDFSENNEERFITEKVKVQTLDSWILDKNISKIDLIKIDVEGNEMKTLRGAKEVISNFKPILLVEMEQRHHEENLKNLVKEIHDWGYSANYLNRKTFKLEPISDDIYLSQKNAEIEDKTGYINNFIFISNSAKI